MATVLTDTSRGRLAYWKESVFGTIPVAAGTKLRITSENLKLNVQTEVSNEIRDDYQVPDIADVGFATGGTIGFEYSYGVYDELWEGCLRDVFGAAVTVGPLATISFAASDNSINDSANGLGGFAVGQHILVSGSASNDGVYRVVTVAAGKLTVTEGTIADEAATSLTAVTVRHGGVLRNGTTLSSYTFERGLLDAVYFFKYTGCRIGAWSFSAAQRGIMTGQLTVLGLDEATATSQFGSGDPTEAPQNDVIDGSAGLELVAYNSALTTMILRQLTFDVNGDLREQPKLMAKELEGVGSGTFGMNIGFTAYFKTTSEYADLRAGNQRSLSFGVKDKQGNRYVFYFPFILPTDGDVMLKGKNDDVLVNMAFGAYRDPVNDFTMQVTRIPKV